MKARLVSDKDFHQLPDVFNRVYGEYSMYMVRTPEQYKHFVEKLNARAYTFVVEDNNTIVGYAIAGVKYMGSAATVSMYEMAAVSKKGYDMLMRKIEDISTQKEAAFIDAVAPAESEIAAYLVSAHFLESRPIATMVYVPDVRTVLELCVAKAVKTCTHGKDITVLFCVGDENIRVNLCEGIICGDEPADVTVVLSSQDLLSLLLNRTTVFSLVMKGKMRITPCYKVLSVCYIVQCLAGDVTMITPYTELL